MSFNKIGWTSFVMMLLNVSYAQKCQINSIDELIADIISKSQKIKNNIDFQKSESLALNLESRGTLPEVELGISKLNEEGEEGLSYNFAYTHTFDISGKKKSHINAIKAQSEVEKSEVLNENELILLTFLKEFLTLQKNKKLLPQYQETVKTYFNIIELKSKIKNLSPQDRVDIDSLSIAKSEVQIELSKIEAEIRKINKLLSVEFGSFCEDTNLKIDFTKVLKGYQISNKKIESSSKIDYFQNNYDHKSALLEIKKSEIVSDIKVTPNLAYEKFGASRNKSIGLNISFDMSLFDFKSKNNYLERPKLEKDLAFRRLEQSKKVANVEYEMEVENSELIFKNLENLRREINFEIKHKRIEELFNRGIVPSTHVIEAHRQLMGFLILESNLEVELITSLAKLKLMTKNVNWRM